MVRSTPPTSRRLRQLAAAFVLFVTTATLGATIASADNSQAGINWYGYSSDCYQMWTEIRHPSINNNYRQDMNVRNLRLPSTCTGSPKFSGSFTLRNVGELWKDGGAALCGSFDTTNSSGVYGYAVGFASNCTNLTAFGWAHAYINGAWRCCGSRWVTHS